jgi:uncharacterized membrane protein
MRIRKSNNHGLYSTVAKHPFLAGSTALLGAGAAYAVVRALKNSDSEELAKEVHIETSVAVNQTPENLYVFWRDFKNLPLFMEHLESVTEVGNGLTHWVAKPIDGRRVEWDAEIYNEKPNELIAWRSLEGSDIVHAGTVRFQPGPQGHGTFVHVTMNYNPPAGIVGKTIAQLLGADPESLIKDDLRRFKQIVEAGEIATTCGQSSGRIEEFEPLQRVAKEKAKMQLA